MCSFIKTSTFYYLVFVKKIQIHLLMQNKYKKFIVGITEHRIFGFQAIPYIIKVEEGMAYYSIIDTVTKDNVDSIDFSLSDNERQIVTIADKYAEREIFRIFSKEKSNKDFIKKLSLKLLDERIKPYIEKRVIQIIELITENDIPLFLKDKKYNTIYKDDAVNIEPEPAQPVFNFIKNHEGTKYYLTLLNKGKELELNHSSARILAYMPCFIILDRILYRVNDIDSKKLVPFFSKKYIEIPKASESAYFRKFILNTIKRYHVNVQGFIIHEVQPEKQAALSIGEDLSGNCVVNLDFFYENKRFHHYSGEKVSVELQKQEPNYEFRKFIRDNDWEQSKTRKLEEMGLTRKNNYFYFNDPEGNASNIYDLINWFNNNAELLKEAGFSIRHDKTKKEYFKGKVELEFQVEEKQDWFDLHAVVRFGEYQIPFSKLKKYILNDIREFELPGGEIAIIPEEWFSRYKDLYEFGKARNNIIEIRKFHFQLVNERIEGISKKYYKDFIRLNEQDHRNIQQEHQNSDKLPAGLNATLRSYQYTGFDWFKKLNAHGFGGCLADDMGLGKTIQTLSMLQHTKENEHHVSLIVMPTSLIHNWENEIRKFTPGLKYYVYTGLDRIKNVQHFLNYDVILTTYGIVRNDVDFFKDIDFYYIILDESQIIKNPESKIYKAIIRLQSAYKLVLTGTPIENSLIDLWAQLNFLNKGLLGNLNFFKNNFVKPIEKQNDVQQEKKLQTLIQPFILRRTKYDVAKDLPPLTDQLLRCDMTTEQSKIYEEEKSKVRNLIFENINKDGVERSAMIILRGLNILRQLANHPVLFHKDYEFGSGKYDDITMNLNSLIAEGHKVLIFSAFVKHLELIEDYCIRQAIQYAKLTGKTSNRKAIIKKFQDDELVKVFLVSLKAGGFGLNLTAADYVFIIDPWWNPASEMQAISRAHRIGQDKRVFVYRFITSHSIEEKINQLQEKKSELANIFINTNNPFRNIDRSEIEDLFS